jgi:hypothetical protein
MIGEAVDELTKVLLMLTLKVAIHSINKLNLYPRFNPIKLGPLNFLRIAHALISTHGILLLS